MKQELAEIKALITEVGQSFQKVLEQLERIQGTQDQLAADQPTETGKPMGGPAVVQVLDGTPESDDAGSKKDRRRQSRAPAAGAAGAQVGQAPRTRPHGGVAGEAPEGGGPGKQGGRPREAERRRGAETAPVG